MKYLMKLNNMSIRSRITVITLLIIVLLIWSLTFVMSNWLEKQLTEQIYAQQYSFASYIADSIDSQIKFRIDSLTAIASGISPELMKDHKKMQMFLAVRPLLNVAFPNSFLVISSKGKVIADRPVLNGRAGSSVTDREYFKEVMTTGKPAVGNPRRGAFSNNPVINFAVPIKDASGQIIGVLAGSVLLSDPALLGSIETSSHKESPDWLVVASPKYKMFVTASDKSRILKPTPRPGINPVFDRFMEGFDGSGIATTTKGMTMLLSAKAIPTAGWFVRVGVPVDKAFAPINNMKSWMYSVAVVSSLINALIIWFVMRQSLRPLQTTTKLIKDSTEGRLLLENLPVTRKDEIGQLITSFNSLLSYRKDAERDLRESEARFRALFEQAAVGVAEIESDTGQFLRINQRYCDIVGYSREEMLRLDFQTITHPDDLPAIFTKMKQLKAGTISEFVLEKRYLSKDGEIVWVTLNVSPLWMPEYVPTKHVAVVQEITERKQTEAALRHSEAHLRTLVTTLPDLVWLKDPQGVYLACNARFESLYGVKESEIIGQTDYAFVDQGLADFFRENDRAAIAAGQQRTNEEELQFASDGHRELVETIKTPMFDDNGELIGVLGIARDITERKRAEEIARQSEQRLNFALQASHTGAWSLNVQDGTATRTLIQAQIFGYETTETDWNIEKFLAHIMPEDRARVRQIIQEGAATRTEWSFECRIRRADDQIRWVFIAGGFEHAGSSERVSGIIQDITERKYMEEHIRTLFHFNEMMLNTVKEGIYGVDTNCKVRFINNSACRMLGWTKEEVIGKISHTTWHHTNRDMTVRQFEQCGLIETLRTGIDTVNNDDLFWRKDGSSFPVDYTSSPMIEDGKIIGSVVTFNDITERKRAEDRIRDSEQRFRAVVETTFDWLWEVDVEGRYTFVSPRVSDILGYAPEEIVGRKPFDFMPEDEAQRIRAFFLDIATEKKPFSAIENINIHKDGHMVVLETSGAPVFGSDGSFEGYRGMDRDITEKRKAETERATLELQLQQAQKMEAVGQLAGGIAHDFNNILSAITGYGYIAQNQLDADNPVQKDIEQILESAKRAAEVTHSLLAFSRKQIIKPLPCDINELIRKSTKLISRLIGEDIEIMMDLSNEALICMVDAAQIDQVLMNLATNARDAMPKGGRFVLSTKSMTIGKTLVEQIPLENKSYAVISVSDTGSGMDQVTASKIFEPFYTTKMAGKGTGLGLAMVHGIINQLDGYVEVESKEGKGTSFLIYLPLVGVNGKIVEQEKSDTPVGYGETILVAEDDPTLRNLYNSILTRNGYEVILAGDGDEALSKFISHKNKVKLIILDMIMPKKSGRQTYEAIKEMEATVEFLFITGYTADRSDKEILKDEGVNFITKPVHPADLLRRIREMLVKS